MESSSRKQITNVCVFGGARSGNNVEYANATRELDRIMIEKKMHLIYAHGNLGMMGVIARIVQEGGNHVLEIVPKINTIYQLKIFSSVNSQCSLLVVHNALLSLSPNCTFLFSNKSCPKYWAYEHHVLININNVLLFFKNPKAYFPLLEQF